MLDLSLATSTLLGANVRSSLYTTPIFILRQIFLVTYYFIHPLSIRHSPLDGVAH